MSAYKNFYCHFMPVNAIKTVRYSDNFIEEQE